MQRLVGKTAVVTSAEAPGGSRGSRWRLHFPGFLGKRFHHRPDPGGRWRFGNGLKSSARGNRDHAECRQSGRDICPDIGTRFGAEDDNGEKRGKKDFKR